MPKKKVGKRSKPGPTKKAPRATKRASARPPRTTIASLARRVEKIEQTLAAGALGVAKALAPAAAEAPVTEKRKVRFTLRAGGPKHVRIRVDGDAELLTAGVAYVSAREHAQDETVPVLLELIGTPNQVAVIDVVHGLPAVISGAVAAGPATHVPHTIWVKW